MFSEAFICPREGCVCSVGGSLSGVSLSVEVSVQGGSLSGGGVCWWGSLVTENPPPPVTVEERAVRILVECILVDKVNAHFCNHYISIFLGTRYSSALFSNAAANPTNYTVLTRK